MQKPIAANSDAPAGVRRGPIGALAAAAWRAWRIVGTGLGFVFFGLFSVVVAVIAMPLLRLWPGQKEIRSQRAVHWFMRGFLRLLAGFLVGRFESDGAEKLREPGQLVVANHPSLLDAVLLISLMPQADCVIKGSHIEHPLMGRAARGAGYIPNWEGPGLVDACAERLIQGRSVIIFPEGTRSPVGELGRFARGAAHIALRAGRDPIPVTIRCDPATLYRGIAWWNVPERKFTLRAQVGDPLLVKNYAEPSMSPAIAARAVTKGLRDHFENQLAGSASTRRGTDPSPSARSAAGFVSSIEN